MNKSSSKNLGVGIEYSKWLFPLILFCVIIVLSILKISGSSIGQYNMFFYGEGYRDPNIVANKPLAIRSDEWLVNTPLTIAQYKENYPVVNKNIGVETNLSVFTDIPTRDWSTIFKPQNIGFLLLPIEVAFAFKWWIIGFLLIVSVYLFILELVPTKKIFAVLFSLGVFFVPFFQWWYSTGSILSFAYLLLILTLLIKLAKKNNSWIKNALISLLLSYLFVSFALILYPPFQIPCVLVGIAFYSGYLIESKPPKKQLLKTLGFVGLGVAIAVIMIGLFIVTKSDVIQSTANTSYPGKRVVESGGYALSHLFSGIYNYRLQCCDRFTYINQSETSNFALLIPAFFVALVYFIKSKSIRNKSIFIILFGVLSLFFLHLFIPAPLWFGKIFLLDKVPLNRLLYGIGIVNLILIIIFVYYTENRTYKKLPNGVILTAISLQAIFGLFVFYSLKHNFPQYLGTSKRELLIALAVNAMVALSIYLLFTKKFKLFAGVFLVGMFLSSYTVNPLYRGLGPLLDNPVVNKINEIDAREPGVWASVDEVYLLNLTAASGVDSITTTYFYPQLDLWRQLDTDKKYENIYNRYSKVSFTTTPINDNFIALVPHNSRSNDFDSYLVSLKPCEKFAQSNISYILSVHTIHGDCLVEVDRVSAGVHTFYIYSVM